LTHDCDLALLTTDDKTFCKNVHPFELGTTPPPQSPVFVAGFPIGGDELSVTQGVISRIGVQTYTHSRLPHLVVQLDAAINPGNSGRPVVYDRQMVGIVFQENKQGVGLGYMIPSEIIQHFLKDVEDGHVDGFSFASFQYVTLDNPATRRYLKMQPEQSGVRIYKVSKSVGDLLKVDDVLLEIEGMKVAKNGNIRLANGEARVFTTLIDQKQIGEHVHFKTLRGRKEMQVDYPRKIPFLCADKLYDRLPDYYITGGFVFTTLTGSLLDKWGIEEAPVELLSLFGG